LSGLRGSPLEELILLLLCISKISFLYSKKSNSQKSSRKFNK